MSSQPTARDVLDAVRTLAAQELGHSGSVSLTSRLVEDLALDSIRMLTLAVAVEDHFGICLDEADEKRLETVGDLVAVVLAKTGTADG